MIKYRNEAAFSKALVAAMRSKGYFVQRIESHETGRGIPDIYVIIGNQALWIELKRVHKPSSRYITIPWRPGQQAWLTDVVKRGQEAITLCAMDDCIVKIKHDVIHFQNVVDINNCETFASIKEMLQ